MIQPGVIIITLIGFILSVLALIFKPSPIYNTVPRKIWTYWEGTQPKTVKLCIESWKKFNPDYEVIVLTKKNFQGYITIPEDIRKHPHFNDSPQRFSDLVRLYALEEHGGIWIDASVLVKQSFDEWLFPKYAEFAGYYMNSYTVDKKYPVIESWFLAANKNSQFIKLWKREFLEMGTFREIKDYMESRKKMGVDFQRLRDPHYLAIYIAALKVVQVDKYDQSTLILRNSEDGPFRYLKDATWYPDRAMKMACGNKEYQTPLMKMRLDERRILEEGLDNELSLEKCGWLE
jgi:hypothetical protein